MNASCLIRMSHVVYERRREDQNYSVMLQKYSDHDVILELSHVACAGGVSHLNLRHVSYVFRLAGDCRSLFFRVLSTHIYICIYIRFCVLKKAPHDVP